MAKGRVTADLFVQPVDEGDYVKIELSNEDD
jgi:hypothetical protein